MPARTFSQPLYTSTAVGRPGLAGPLRCSRVHPVPFGHDYPNDSLATTHALPPSSLDAISASSQGRGLDLSMLFGGGYSRMHSSIPRTRRWTTRRCTRSAVGWSTAARMGLVAALHPEWMAAPTAAAKGPSRHHPVSRFWRIRRRALPRLVSQRHCALGSTTGINGGQALMRRSADLSPEIAVPGRADLGSE